MSPFRCKNSKKNSLDNNQEITGFERSSRRPLFSTKAFKKVVCLLSKYSSSSHLLSFYQILRKRNLYDTFYPTCIKVRQLWAAQATHSALAAQAFRHVFGYCFFQKISKRKMLVAVLALSWLRAKRERDFSKSKARSVCSILA